MPNSEFGMLPNRTFRIPNSTFRIPADAPPTIGHNIQRAIDEISMRAFD